MDLSAVVISAVGTLIAVICAAERLPAAATRLVVACIPLVHAIRALLRACRTGAPADDSRDFT
ncbi:hypothetical protein GCM10010441_55390 [Kitasatospora paracochleata]